MKKLSVKPDVEYEYNFLILLALFVFMVVIPVFLFGPYLFSDLAFISLSKLSTTVAFTSVAIGLWLLLIARFLRGVEKETAIELVKSSIGGELMMLVIPFILYFGTKILLLKAFRSISER